MTALLTAVFAVAVVFSGAGLLTAIFLIALAGLVCVARDR